MFETPQIWLLFWRWCCSLLLCCIHLIIGVTLFAQREEETLAKMHPNWTSHYIRRWGRKSSTYLGLDTSRPMRPIPGAPSRKRAWVGNSWLFGLCCWFGFDCDVSQKLDRKAKQLNIEWIEDWSSEVMSWIFCGQKNWKFEIISVAHIPTVINTSVEYSEIPK